MLKGRVTAGGRGVPYATVQLLGTSIGVSCNDAGEYTLKLPAGHEGDTVLVRSVGYESVRLPVSFMPFSALVGYKEAVIETARITDKKIILDEEAKEILDNKISLIKSKLSLKPVVSITYFVPDKSKSGGSYKSAKGIIKKIDLYKGIIVIDDNKISICDIIDIDMEDYYG